jgi:hypothetical protein
LPYTYERILFCEGCARQHKDEHESESFFHNDLLVGF